MWLNAQYFRMSLQGGNLEIIQVIILKASEKGNDLSRFTHLVDGRAKSRV